MYGYFNTEIKYVIFAVLHLLLFVYGSDFLCFHSGSLFTNSNWFAFEDGRTSDDHASSAPKVEGDDGVERAEHVIVEEDEDLADTAASKPREEKPTSDDDTPSKFPEGSSVFPEGSTESETSGSQKPREWVGWREGSDSTEMPPSSNAENVAQLPPLPNGEVEEELKCQPDIELDKMVTSPSEDSPDSKDSAINPSQSTEEAGEGNQSIEKVVDSKDAGDDSPKPAESGKDN